VSASVPRVSVGLVVYNGENFIQEAINSILNQTYENLELIISDNASEDGTQDICTSFAEKDKRVRYFRNEKNLGASPNYNRAFELSRGEYFKWADHDDLMAASFLEKCVGMLDENPSVCLSYTKALIIDEHGNKVVNYDPEPILSGLPPYKRFEKCIFTPNLFIQLSGLIRSEVIRKAGGYGSYPAADEILMAKLSLYGQFQELPERLFFVRMHAQQSTFGALAPGNGAVKFSQRDRVLFFNTAYKGKIILPYWLYLFDGIRSISRAPTKVLSKLYCVLQMVRWAARSDHLRALGKDVLLATGWWMGRVFLW